MITEEWIGSPHRRVHYFAKICNKIMIGGQIETIPAGTGVITGGVEGDMLDICIDKVCGQKAAPDTLYYAYVFCDGDTSTCNMKMTLTAQQREWTVDASHPGGYWQIVKSSGHKEDPTYGNEVNVSDPAQSLVGMIKTNENGLINGGSRWLHTESWFNRMHVGLSNFIGWGGWPIAEVCKPVGDATMEPLREYEISVLIFSVNSIFREGYTVPNVRVEGTLANTQAGGFVELAVGVENNGNNKGRQSHRSTYFQNGIEDAGSAGVTLVGGGGTEEGILTIYPMLGNRGKGGCARVIEGRIFTSPHHS
jgi:hypothetical protein